MGSRALRGYAVRAAGKAGEPITFLASTPGVARDGLEIPLSAWDLTNYRRNPIVGFAHKFDRPPIGRTVRLDVTERGLIADVVFDQGDGFAREIERKVRDQFLNAISVSWDPKEQQGRRVTKAELLELSIVPVPGDADALALARSAFGRLPAGRGAQADPKLAAAVRGTFARLSDADLRELHTEAVVKPLVRDAYRRLKLEREIGALLDADPQLGRLLDRLAAS